MWGNWKLSIERKKNGKSWYFVPTGLSHPISHYIFIPKKVKFGRKGQLSRWFWGVLRGLDLFWESATPPTHIWERCPKKTGTYIYENVYWAIISRSGQDQKQLRLGAPPTPVGKNCNFYPIYFDGSQKNIRFLYIKCHLNIYLFRCHTFTSNAVCSYCKGTHCIECTGVTR